MEALISILTDFGLGALGVLLYAVMSVREHLGTQFSIGKLWKDNKSFWLWSVVMVFILAVIVQVSPESAQAIKSFGIDLEQAGGFIAVALGIANLTDSMQKKKLNKKHPDENV